ncbi:hypothetical protein [Sorangium sp. So ce1000]|uniref:hypothetical protein n=1 Tax=Sorangium sp. So ce1000 TaxID=3133325 RepID=UPI003F5FA6B3
MKRAVASPSLVVLAAVLAAGQPGCHRERESQDEASPGAQGSSATTASAPATSASPAGGASGGGAGPVDLDAPHPGTTGSSRAGAPPPSTAGAGATSPAPGMITNPSTPVGKPFDQDSWLAARGVTWRPDASCWLTLATSPPQRLNDCLCRKTLDLPEAELMVCSRAREPEAEVLPAVLHTVLYAARGGALRAVLDVPTSVTLDDCAPRTPIPCSIALDVRVEGDAVRFEEPANRTMPACDHPWIASNKPIPGAAGWNSASWQRARATYRRICDTRGRYVWQRGALRRAP